MSLLRKLFCGHTISEKLLDGVLTSGCKDQYGCVVAWVSGLAGRVTADMWIASEGVQFFERRSLALPVGRVHPLQKNNRVGNMSDVVSRLSAFDGRSFHGTVRDGEILSVCYRTSSKQAKIDARGYSQNPQYLDLARFLRSEGDKCSVRHQTFMDEEG
jgi:hypothetical protein